MANKTPKTRDPESARRQASEQWSDPEKRARMLAGIRKANGIDPPANAAEIIQKGAENGATLEQMARALGVSRSTLERWRTEHPEIARAIQQGKKVEHDKLVGKLFELAMAGNVTCILFALKSRHNYSDQGAPLVENRISINYQLPAALKPEQYLETLAAEAQVVRPEQARKLLADPRTKRAVVRELVRGDGNDDRR
jgi:transcriptional regulator with XRE-family HTH domain